MLFSVSIGSNLVIGVIGYLHGTESLSRIAYDQLSENRDARARELTALFDTIEASLLVAARDGTVVAAEAAFQAGFDELNGVPAGDDDGESAPTLSADQLNVLESYFENVFAPDLEEATGEPVDAASYLPSAPAGRYLLYHYAVENSGPATNDAGDGSAWSASHAEFHDTLRRMAEVQGYEDLVLIDRSGYVVYSVGKSVDLGTNLIGGPYQYSSLASAFGQAMAAGRIDQVTFGDFDAYPPSAGAPVAWGVAPFGAGGELEGAIAVRLPVERIDEIMTADGNWVDSGLGETGEAYLVGDDRLMRSQSRVLVEDPQVYFDRATASGVPDDVAQRAVDAGHTLLLQPVSTDAVESAFDGLKGETVTAGYLGGQTVSAYAPLPLTGLNWVVVSQLDSDEAFAPVNDFAARLAISCAILVIIVSLISVLLAHFAVRPLRRLRDAARRIAAGEQGVQVEAEQSDELADVATAFNDMSRSLELKADLLEKQQVQNEQLLHTLMPDGVAKRYKEGARTIVEDHREVTVLFADIVGFEEFSRGLGSEKALDILNDIVRAFDEAAEEHGVDRVRTTRQGYLASCGLNVPRVDGPRRMVEFAFELVEIVQRFARQHGTELSLRAGIDSGDVTSGIVGRGNVLFDLWGDAVSLAFRLQNGSAESGIFLTERVVDGVPDTLPFVESGVIETDGGSQRVWRIDPAALGN
jgi:class 3 adenylate cyclase